MKMKPRNPLQGYDPAKHELFPKQTCSKCYGRGWVGRNLTVNEYAKCMCLRYREKVVTSEPDPRPYELMVEPVQSAPVSDEVITER